MTFFSLQQSQHLSNPLEYPIAIFVLHGWNLMEVIVSSWLYKLYFRWAEHQNLSFMAMLQKSRSFLLAAQMKSLCDQSSSLVQKSLPQPCTLKVRMGYVLLKLGIFLPMLLFLRLASSIVKSLSDLLLRTELQSEDWQDSVDRSEAEGESSYLLRSILLMWRSKGGSDLLFWVRGEASLSLGLVFLLGEDSISILLLMIVSLIKGETQKCQTIASFTAMLATQEQADANNRCYTSNNPPICAFLALYLGFSFLRLNINFFWLWLGLLLWPLWFWLIAGGSGGFVVDLFRIKLLSYAFAISFNDLVQNLLKLLIARIDLQRCFDVSHCILVLRQFISRCSSFAQSLSV